jgi:hypothetical protein
MKYATIMERNNRKNILLSLVYINNSNKYNNKSKSKAVPLHAMEALGGERKYSSYSFTTSALDGGEWSASCPEPVWTQRIEEKILYPCRGSNPDRPVVQPLVRHYTD